MRAWAEVRRIRYTLFVLLAIGIHLLDESLVRLFSESPQHLRVSAGASLDFILTITAIYYWLLVRPGFRSRWSAGVVALVGVLHATYLYPGATFLRGTAAGMLDLALVGFVAVQVRRRIGDGQTDDEDPVDAIRSVTSRVLPTPFVRNLFAGEFAILYYALFSWRAEPHVPNGAKVFTLHKRTGRADLFFGLAIASVMEALPVHLVIARWNATDAWIVTGLTLYGAIWLFGLARSFDLRPALVGPDFVELRYGLLASVRFPRKMIASVRKVAPCEAMSGFRIPGKSEPNLTIELTGSVDAEKLFGTRRPVSCVALAADDPLELERALASS
jgi:hypothetical protein